MTSTSTSIDTSAAATAGATFIAENEEKVKMNQYWYSPATIAAMVSEIESVATHVAFLSTPSVFFSLRDKELQKRSRLFDFDDAFGTHPGFVKFNYKEVEAIPAEYHHAFDYVVIDPPFITDVVWEKYAQAAKLPTDPTPKGYTHQRHSSASSDLVSLILSDWKSQTPHSPAGRVLLSTIPENYDLLYDLLGAHIVPFRPSIPHLIYQYSFYINYHPTQYLGEYNPEIDQDMIDEEKAKAKKAAAQATSAAADATSSSSTSTSISTTSNDSSADSAAATDATIHTSQKKTFLVDCNRQ